MVIHSPYVKTLYVCRYRIVIFVTITSFTLASASGVLGTVQEYTAQSTVFTLESIYNIHTIEHTICTGEYSACNHKVTSDCTISLVSIHIFVAMIYLSATYIYLVTYCLLS